jgi:hypothetical protein
MEREVADLYGLPLEEFTAARNELARRLKRDGDARAHDVGRLPKPTLAVWAINQLARHEELGVRRLLAAGAALRKAQERALAGGAAGALSKAQADEREAVGSLVGRARALLEGAGRPATDATLARVARTLSAAAVDESARPLLKAGRLAVELEPSGFEALAGMEAPGRPVKDDGAAERRRAEQAELRRLRDRVRALEREADEAERAAARAEAAARRARTEADLARKAADEAGEELGGRR